MIFIGELDSLVADYHASWSGRSRGKARTAYSIGTEGLRLRSDFIRWLERRAIKNKEVEMVLTERIEQDGKVVLVFTGNDKGKTVERCLAETICALAEKDGSVSSWAIHFSSLHHPFSTTQRLREMKDKFESWWMAQFAIEFSEGGKRGQDDFAYRFEKSEFKYYFSPHFVAWLRREYLEKEPDHVPAD